jgi:hypothetical protein
MLYRVIYLWRGDRHCHLQDLPKQEAEVLARQFRNDNWQAWIEPIV